MIAHINSNKLSKDLGSSWNLNHRLTPKDTATTRRTNVQNVITKRVEDKLLPFYFYFFFCQALSKSLTVLSFAFCCLDDISASLVGLHARLFFADL